MAVTGRSAGGGVLVYKHGFGGGGIGRMWVGRGAAQRPLLAQNGLSSFTPSSHGRALIVLAGGTGRLVGRCCTSRWRMTWADKQTSRGRAQDRAKVAGTPATK